MAGRGGGRGAGRGAGRVDRGERAGDQEAGRTERDDRSGDRQSGRTGQGLERASKSLSRVVGGGVGIRQIAVQLIEQVVDLRQEAGRFRSRDRGRARLGRLAGSRRLGGRRLAGRRLAGRAARRTGREPADPYGPGLRSSTQSTDGSGDGSAEPATPAAGFEDAPVPDPAEPEAPEPGRAGAGRDRQCRGQERDAQSERAGPERGTNWHGWSSVEWLRRSVAVNPACQSGVKGSTARCKRRVRGRAPPSRRPRRLEAWQCVRASRAGRSGVAGRVVKFRLRSAPGQSRAGRRGEACWPPGRGASRRIPAQERAGGSRALAAGARRAGR